MNAYADAKWVIMMATIEQLQADIDVRFSVGMDKEWMVRFWGRKRWSGMPSWERQSPCVHVHFGNVIHAHSGVMESRIDLEWELADPVWYEELREFVRGIVNVD